MVTSNKKWCDHNLQPLAIRAEVTHSTLVLLETFIFKPHIKESLDRMIILELCDYAKQLLYLPTGRHIAIK